MFIQITAKVLPLWPFLDIVLVFLHEQLVDYILPLWNLIPG